MENHLIQARRALWKAEEFAVQCGADGYSDQIGRLVVEVHKMIEHSADNKVPKLRDRSRATPAA